MTLITLMTTSGDLAASAERLDRCLARLATGDGDALEDVYHMTRTPVYTFALSLLKNSHDAEDVLQDCMVQIFSGAERYRSAGKPMAWVLTITKNLCYQKLRERQKTADLPQEDWEFWLSANQGMTAEDRMIVRSCMESLSDQERHIVALHAVSGLRHREIAALLELPLSTVLSKYNRAIKKLREIMERSEAHD